MSPDKPYYNLAIVGAGRQGVTILEALVPPRRPEQPLRVVGVADVDPQAPGMQYASQHNLLVAADFAELLALPELDIIINATGRPEVARQLQEQRPQGVMVLNVDRPASWEAFWDLISMGLSGLENGPLKIGIIGGGKGGHEILQLLAGDRRYQRRFQILGVADPNPRAPGILLAKEAGIPTFHSCTDLLRENPDLILELTGDAQVREAILQQKAPHTQVIDHTQARLFWDLLHREEDQVRSRVESEIRLAGQRTRFQRIFDHLPDPVLVLKPDYTVEEVNRTFLSHFRKKPEEVIGRPCFEVFHQFDTPCDRKGMHCPLPGVLESCQTSQVSQCFPTADGTMRHVEITISPLCPPEAAQKRVIEVIKDMTPRKELEEALQSSEARTGQLLKETRESQTFLETIVNGIQDHMMVIDLDYRIIEVNRSLLDMVGLGREDVVGKHCYEVSHHADHPCSMPDHPCPLQDAVASGKASSATHVHFDKDGREHYYHVVCHPLFDEEGRVHQVVDLSRDITEEIRARARVLHDDKMASLGKLSASVVHEINNPLTGILNFIKLIRRLLNQGQTDATEINKMQHYLDIVYNETSRVSKTVSNLLAFSRKTKPEFKPVDLNAVINETMSLTDYQMRLQGINVTCRLAADLPPVLADSGQIKQALLNLLLNAQDAMPQGGTLTVETKEARGKEVVLRVADTGVGIPKQSFSHIFEPFYTTKKAGSGVGLGLSVVYGIVRDHMGTIKVESTVGQGTTFTIRLPVYKAEGASATT